MAKMPRSAIAACAVELLGCPGRLLSWSKSAYRENHPGFVPNANVIVGTTKVWYGDIDTERDMDALCALADMTGEPVHVLHEMDGRFDNEEHPLIDRAVKSFGGDA